MEQLIEYYTPTDEFTIKMQKMNIKDFAFEYEELGEVNKKIRNAYDNRMRNRNL